MSRGKKAYLQYEALLSAANRALGLSRRTESPVDADAESYDAVMKLIVSETDLAGADAGSMRH